MRRTILLATRLAAGALAQPAVDRTAARRDILRQVGDAIELQSRIDEDTDAASLEAELHERLDTPGWDEDLDNISLDEVVARYCRDLGVTRPTKNGNGRRRTPADIHALEQRARACPARPAPGLPPGHPWANLAPTPAPFEPEAPSPHPLERTG